MISGRGSNLHAILQRPALRGACAGVIASRPGAPGLEHARDAGIPTFALDRREHEGREAFDAAVAEQLDAWGVTWVVLAGWMRILTEPFLERFAGRIVNIHPSLLPAYPGLHPQQQAIDDGAVQSGCTVHLVEPGPVDGGRILGQASVGVLPTDTAEQLSQRILEAEHVLYPRVLDTLLREAPEPANTP